MKLARLELAILYKQKKVMNLILYNNAHYYLTTFQFVAHPNIQQLLAAIWYEGVPGFRRKSAFQKIGIIVKFVILFPFYCMLYMIAPETKYGKLMRKPFMKFLIHASSYLFFLCKYWLYAAEYLIDMKVPVILILVSQRAEDLLFHYFGTESMQQMVAEKFEKQRGNVPTILEYVVFIYVIGI